MSYAAHVADLLSGRKADLNQPHGLCAYPTTIASANDLDLSNKPGNYFTISGTTTINGIKLTNVTDVSSAAYNRGVLVLKFTGVTTIAHNASPSAGYAAILTDTGSNIATTANSALLLVFNGTAFQVLGGINGSAFAGISTVAGGATSFKSLLVKKQAIADNTATSVITVTVPNANVSAGIRLTLVGALGTGTDTFESTRNGTGMCAVARQTGANAVGVLSTIAQTAIATVSGGGTLTMAYGLSAVSGAVGATNTFDIQVTLVKTGTITDLQVVILAEAINAEATGITMAAS